MDSQVGDGRSAFAELLRERRIAAALSQEALAERAGLSVDAIRAIERGRRSPRADTITRLSEILDLTVGDQEVSVTGFTAMPVISPAGLAPSLPAGQLMGRTRELTALF
ncbi:MAG: helix-turn-helix domain-containing protein, partial [Chloroflexota bacterium]